MRSFRGYSNTNNNNNLDGNNQNGDLEEKNDYLNIYSSFSNVTNPLGEMLKDPLHELDLLEKNLSKSLSELNEIHQQILKNNINDLESSINEQIDEQTDYPLMSHEHRDYEENLELSDHKELDDSGDNDNDEDIDNTTPLLLNSESNQASHDDYNRPKIRVADL